MYFLCCTMYFCVVLCIVCFVSFSVLFVCICILNYCHRLTTHLRLIISYHISLKNNTVRIWTVTTMLVKIQVFWDMMLCSLSCSYDDSASTWTQFHQPQTHGEQLSATRTTYHFRRCLNQQTLIGWLQANRNVRNWSNIKVSTVGYVPTKASKADRRRQLLLSAVC
jgi:hypothetical protein